MAVVLIVAGVAVLAVLAVLLLRAPDDRNAQLRSAPGYGLTLADAQLLWDHTSASLGGAGGDRSMAWGVQASPDEVLEAVAAQLGALGYEQVQGRKVEADVAATTLGVFARDGVWFRVRWVDLPHRIPGGTILTGGYRGVVYTTISNAERPSSGA